MLTMYKHINLHCKSYVYTHTLHSIRVIKLHLELAYSAEYLLPTS